MCLFSSLVFLSYLNNRIIFFSLFQVFVSSLTTFSPVDDLYLEGRTSGDLPIDDEDGEDDGSGSGSGFYGKETTVLFYLVIVNNENDFVCNSFRKSINAAFTNTS